MIVMVKFETAVTGEDGRTYSAQVCGRQAAGNMWEGWIEFEPHGGGEVLRTPRETTQPNYKDLEYWATGLTEAYLEGALERALDPDLPQLGPRDVPAHPVYPGPATGVKARTTQSAPRPAHAVLNPLEVYAQGEDILHDELSALDESHLRTIVRAYELADEKDVDLLAMHRQSLVELIIAAVRRRVG
ncbi:MAG TPA: hypothetical protein VFZ69_11065 [Longimicrobiales bacterium]